MRKLSLLSQIVKQSAIRQMLKEVADLRLKGIDVIQLSTGQPSLPIDEQVFEETVAEMRKNRLLASSYTPTKGLRSVLEAIQNDLKVFGNIDVSLDEIVITEGATEGLLLTDFAILDRDDEIIIMDPSYVSYAQDAIIAGAKPILVEQKMDEGYQPNINRILEHITPKTKAILVATPDNPTGRVINKETAKALLDIAEDHDLWFIVDEAYKHLIYEGEHYWFWRESRARERTICVNTFSKDPAMTGFRLGYVYGPKEVIAAIEKFKQYSTLSSNTPAQIAATIYLRPEVKKRILEYTLRIYRSRRDKIYESFKEYLPEANAHYPEGAMYMFANLNEYLRKANMNDQQLMLGLVREKHVAIVAGSSFGETGKNHMRFTFVGENEERIEKGMKLLREFIDEKTVNASK
ncbi:MAG TPA: pyridoxal phosphate-dependent aminotransferase [Geobacterales bacterium]|nr:pyridoxal phosphate-dependent aminotransferase [Geobacterales bacterium]